MKSCSLKKSCVDHVAKVAAERLFDLNCLLAEFTQSKRCSDSFKLFSHIHSSKSLRPDHYSLSTALTVSANTHSVAFGNQLHAYAIQTGLKAFSHVANSLLSLYAKAEDLNSVRCVFREIQCPDIYSWTTLLSACTRLGHIDYALELFGQVPKSDVAIWNAIITGCNENEREEVGVHLFREMWRVGVEPDNYTYASILSLCSVKLLDYGKHVHSAVIKTGFLFRTSVVNSLINMYFNSKCVADACGAFEEAEVSVRDQITYNVMIDGLGSNDRNEESFLMFIKMQEASFSPTELTFVSVLSSCSSTEVGCQVQAEAIKMGFFAFTAVSNATMTMYSCCRDLPETQKVFERMEERDLVSWNIMISAYSQENLGKSANLTFLEMRRVGIEPDEFTYGSILAASDSLSIAEMVHSFVYKKDFMKVEVSNALASAYCKHGDLNQAFKVFSDIPCKNLISWNSIISGFLMCGSPLEGLELFSELLTTELKPNSYTLSLILSICSSIAALSHGKNVHSYILRHGFSSEISLSNALITMYAKCGYLDRSLKVFNGMVKRDTISWNALISAYAQHGQGREAVYCFEAMHNSPGLKPDQATFTAVLSACSHAGLVDDGTRIFYLMLNDYGFVPTTDHFSCIIDLLGRSGYLNEAERIVTSGHFFVHSNIFWALFSACAAYGDLRLGRTVAELLLEREHNDPSIYVLLSNIYAAVGQWEEAASLRDVMRKIGNMKQPGCSWIRL